MAFLLLQFLRFLGSDVDLYIYTGQQLLNERENKMMRANFSWWKHVQKQPKTFFLYARN